MSEALRVVCPRCDTVNRVPGERLDQHPICGRCKNALFDGHPVTLTTANFDRHLSGELPIVVDFWAEWCGPCRMMGPEFEAATADLEPRIRTAKLDTEAAPDIARRYSVRSIPTVILFKDGREIARQAGAMDRARIARWVRSAVG